MGSPFIERLGGTLVQFLGQGAAVAAGLVILLAVARRASARVRYGLACGALAMLAVLPVVTFLLRHPSASGAVPGSSALRFTPGETITPIGPPSDGRLTLVVSLWAVGVALLSVRLGGALLHTERWRRRHTRPIGSEWQGRSDALARRIGLSRAVGILISDRIEVPSAWGILKPLVALPASLVAGMSPEQLETILLHELTHVRRHDYLVNLLQTVLETVLFYHPAVWWVSSVVRRGREHCCDDAVVAALGDPMPYARTLLQLEERRLTLPLPTLSARDSNLMNRIARLLGTEPSPSRLSSVAPTFAALGVLGVMLGGTFLAQARPTQKPTPKQIAQKAKVLAEKAARQQEAALQMAKAEKNLAEMAARKAALAQLFAADALTQQEKVAIAEAMAQKAMAEASARKEALAQAFAQASAGKATLDQALANKKFAEFRNRDLMAKLQALDEMKGLSKGKKNVRPTPVPKIFPPAADPGPVNLQEALSAMPPLQGGFGGGGQSLPFTVESNGEQISVDADHMPFSLVMREVAKKGKTSVVIAEGKYADITLVLTDQGLEPSIEMLCRAAKATFTREDNGRGIVYFIKPDDNK